MSYCLADIGNTSVHYWVIEGDTCMQQHRLYARDENWHAQLQAFSKVEEVIVGSVNENILDRFLSIVEPVTRAQVLSVGKDIPYPIDLHVDTPKEVGVDRVVNSVAAFDKMKEACIVVDSGSGLTFDVVSDDGNYLGGVIAAGISMTAEALHKNTHLLPLVTFDEPSSVIGKNTIHCIQSGLYWGSVSIIEGVITRIRKELRSSPKVIATGGDAELLARNCTIIDLVDPNLTLRGLQLSYEAYRK